MKSYTVVVETPSQTKTYEFDNIDKAVEFMRNERENEIDAEVYILYHMGNILSIK